MQRVLIVEDELQIAHVLREVLMDEGYHTELAHHGRAALAIIDQYRPDLIISDIMMPQMTGVELCRALAAHPTHHTIPMMLMSAGVPPPRNADQPYSLFIAKPFDIDTLLGHVAHLLRGAV